MDQQTNLEPGIQSNRAKAIKYWVITACLIAAGFAFIFFINYLNRDANDASYGLIIFVPIVIIYFIALFIFFNLALYFTLKKSVLVIALIWIFIITLSTIYFTQIKPRMLQSTCAQHPKEYWLALEGSVGPANDCIKLLYHPK